MVIIQTRVRHLINTDPQRRCYNGCNFSEALVWGSWEDLVTVSEEKVEETIAWWKDLNSIAIQGRGEGARRQFRVKEE